jgi:type IV pilus assembly protein PilO
MAAFITGLEDLQRSLAVKNLMVSQTEFRTVTGSIAVDFFALPKIYDTSDDPYLEWPYTGEYGKINPFAAPGYDLTFNVGAYVTDPTNLAVSIPALSELALLRASSAETAGVNLVITPAAGGFGCAVQIGEAVYPAAGSVTVTSEGPVIRVLVTSTQRVGAADLSGITLNVSNTSELPVMVIVVGDDAVLPRIAVGTLEGNVSVR